MQVPESSRQLPARRLEAGEWLTEVLHQTLGFMAFYMIRLTIGMHVYPAFDFIPGRAERVVAEVQALSAAKHILELRAESIRGKTRGNIITKNAMEKVCQVSWDT